MSWSRLRRIVQIVFLVAFVGLTIGGLGLGSSWAFSSLFSRLDPLVGLSAALASRAFVAFWAAALLTVVLSIALGRVWCGWVCPLGTLIELAPLPALLRGKLSPRWRMGKYVTLAVVLGAAFIGNLGPMILDPVTIIARPLQELARPFVGNDAVGQGVGAALSRSAVHTVAFLSLIPLVLVLALNLAEKRAWCRDVCPLGGLLGVLSKLPGVRRVVDAETCTSCARCAKACPTDAIARKDGYASSSAECIACMRCIDACPTGANAFRLAPPHLLAPAYEPSRRDALIAVGATGLGVAAVVLPIARADAEILRPPSTSSARLAELCVRCGACYSACPTGSLRPSVSFVSEAGPWTPMLDDRPAHCTMNCNRCAVPCPTDAIHTPTQFEYVELGLGLRAEVDKTRCRAWANNHACMQCQSTCPISGALVGIERPANLPSRDGGPPMQVPVVNGDLCVGCYQCSLSCPVHPAAIGSPLPPYDPRTARPQMPSGVRGMPLGMGPGQ